MVNELTTNELISKSSTDPDIISTAKENITRIANDMRL
jgi:hypothetical protein